MVPTFSYKYTNILSSCVLKAIITYVILNKMNHPSKFRRSRWLNGFAGAGIFSTPLRHSSLSVPGAEKYYTFFLLAEILQVFLVEKKIKKYLGGKQPYGNRIKEPERNPGLFTC